MRYTVLMCFIGMFLGCAYNSRNVIDVRGNNLSFSYGLISMKNVTRVLLYRESNVGDGDPLPVYNFEPKEQIGNIINAVPVE